MTPTRAARCSRTCRSRCLCLLIALILLDLGQRLPYGVRDGVDLGIREFREARQRQDLARGLPRARALRPRRERSPPPEERLAPGRPGGGGGGGGGGGPAAPPGGGAGGGRGGGVEPRAGSRRRAAVQPGRWWSFT